MNISPESKARSEAAGHQAALLYMVPFIDFVAEQYEHSLDQVLDQPSDESSTADG